MVLEQIMRTVMRRIGEFFVGRERQDDVAIGLEALLDVFDQVGDEDRGHRLVVDGAAAAEIAVDLLQLERVEIPVLALSFDHIEVSNKEDRLARASAAQSRNEVTLTRPCREYLYVGGR